MTEQETSVQAAPPSPKAKGLADMVAPSLEEARTPALGGAVWVKIAIIALLLAVLNYEQYAVVVGTWMHDPNWMHGFIIPLFSLYLLYTRRHEIASAPRKSCLWGVPIVLGAIVLQVLCVYPIRFPYLYYVTMVVMLLGLALWLGGWRIFVLTFVPIAFLVFAMPFSQRMHAMMAYPLQELAAKASTLLMRLFGAQIVVNGSSLQVMSVSGVNYPVEVAEACSGVRSLMAFVALGVAMAYLEERPLWQRAVFVICTVPVAIACNVLRVTMTCTSFVLDKPEFGKDFMHEFTGMLMLIPAFGMLWLIGRFLRGLYVEEDSDDESGDDAPSDEAPAEAAK